MCLLVTFISDANEIINEIDEKIAFQNNIIWKKMPLLIKNKILWTFFDLIDQKIMSLIFWSTTWNEKGKDQNLSVHY